MGTFDDGYTDALIDAARQPAAALPTGFLENFSATAAHQIQEGLSISELQNYNQKVAIRNEAIKKTVANLTANFDPADLLKPGTLSTTAELARKSYNDQLSALSARHPEIKTDPDILKEIIEDSRRIREKSESVSSNANFAGKIGSFAGAMAASFADPLVLASIPFGASASASILRTALIEAGINMASEAAIQPFVYRYKQTLGSPYDLGEALTSVAAAGAGGAILGGGMRAVGKGVEHLRARSRLAGIDDLLESFEKNIPEPTQIQRDAANVLGDYADVLRETPFEARPELDEYHLRATAKALSDLADNRTVDVNAVRMQQEAAPVLVEKPKLGPDTSTENQSLGQFVKNSGGVSIEQAGALRGEYDALFENGGRDSGAVKRKAGMSADDMAQKAFDSGFIDEPDPQLLKEALQRDLGGDKVYSAAGDNFERRMDLQIDREFEQWAKMAETEYEAMQTEVAAKAKGLLEEGDVTIAHPDGSMRSAKEVLAELDDDVKAANILQKCMTGGAE